MSKIAFFLTLLFFQITSSYGQSFDFLNHTYLSKEVWGGESLICITEKHFIELKFDYNEGQKPFTKLPNVYAYSVKKTSGLYVFSLTNIETGKKQVRNIIASDLLLFDLDNGLCYSKDNFFYNTIYGPYFVKRIADFSSVLSEGNVIYQMVEYNKDGGVRFNFVPWVEDVKGYGIGESFIYRPDSNFVNDDTYFVFVNGFVNKEKPNLFFENSRIKKLKMEVFDQKNSLLDSKTLSLSDSMNPQEIAYRLPVSTSNVKFTIMDVYKGSKFEDTCLSWCAMGIHESKK